MSRIGNKPIDVPKGTNIEIKGDEVIVSGPKGTLKRTIRSEVSLTLDNNKVFVSRSGNDKIHKSLHGLTRTLVYNMIEGVSKGFTKSLDLVGVGYRCQLQNKKLVLQVGYSHPVEIEAPEGIEFAVEGANKIHVKGIDKQLVGDVAAKIRAVRKPEPYKGKGIKYSTEVVRRKAGKSGKK